jgi:hypothetical protein
MVRQKGDKNDFSRTQLTPFHVRLVRAEERESDFGAGHAHNACSNMYVHFLWLLRVIIALVVPCYQAASIRNIHNRIAGQKKYRHPGRSQ